MRGVVVKKNMVIKNIMAKDECFFGNKFPPGAQINNSNDFLGTREKLELRLSLLYMVEIINLNYYNYQ